MKKCILRILCALVAMILGASPALAGTLEARKVKSSETPRGFVELYNDELLGQMVNSIFASQPADTRSALKDSFSLVESEFHSLMFDDKPAYAGALSYGMAFAVVFDCDNTIFIAKEDRYASNMRLVWLTSESQTRELIFYIISYLYAYCTGADTTDCVKVGQWAGTIPADASGKNRFLDFPTFTAEYVQEEYPTILFYRKTEADKAPDWPSYVVAKAMEAYRDMNIYGQLWPSEPVLAKAAGISLADFVHIESCEILSPSKTRPSVVFKGNFQGRESASSPFVKYNFSATVQCEASEYGYFSTDFVNARLNIEKSES